MTPPPRPPPVSSVPSRSSDRNCSSAAAEHWRARRRFPEVDMKQRGRGVSGLYDSLRYRPENASFPGQVELQVSSLLLLLLRFIDSERRLAAGETGTCAVCLFFAFSEQIFCVFEWNVKFSDVKLVFKYDDCLESPRDHATCVPSPLYPDVDTLYLRQRNHIRSQFCTEVRKKLQGEYQRRKWAFARDVFMLSSVWISNTYLTRDPDKKCPSLSPKQMFYFSFAHKPPDSAVFNLM